MFRLGTISLCGLVLFVAGISTAATPPDERETRIQKNLAVQKAMYGARMLLMQNQAQKAVEVLEEQLAHVNGNTEYLTLLRDCYRIYVNDLYLAGNPEQAKRYLARLSILDPNAVAQMSRPQVQVTQQKPEPEPVKQAKLFPNFKVSNPFVKKEEPKNVPPAKPAVVRAQADDGISLDPFARTNRRELTAEVNKSQEHLSRGAEEFSRKRYSEARLCFEQAYQADQGSIDICRDQWAYCLIKTVTDQLEQPAPDSNWTEMQQQVKNAVKMAPKLASTGEALLQQLEQHAKTQPARPQQVAGGGVTKVKHWGENKEGWQVTESAHFRIFHRQNNDFGEQVAQIAEKTRTTMYRKWFDVSDVEWEPQCELILHPTSASYSQMTGVPSSSPGHSRIESDPSGRVLTRRMDLRQDINGMLEAVLPHETTHVVIAGMFGARHVPRWVDEGIAVLSEPNEKIEQHRRNLHKNHQDGNLFGLRELMELNDYPQPRRINAFYAQSVVLVEFLAKQSGPKVFTAFVKDGLHQGYEAALQKHYNLTFPQLEKRWTEQVLNTSGPLANSK